MPAWRAATPELRRCRHHPLLATCSPRQQSPETPATISTSEKDEKGLAALRERYAGAQAPKGVEAPAADGKKDRKKPQAGQGSEGGERKPKEKKPKEKKKPREAAE